MFNDLRERIDRIRVGPVRTPYTGVGAFLRRLDVVRDRLTRPSSAHVDDAGLVEAVHSRSPKTPGTASRGSWAPKLDRPATLSVCCITRDGSPSVIELLEQLREVADEVFVAVDSRAEVTSLGPLVGLVDQLTRFEFAPPFERSLAWAHAQCHGDWILRIDSDEVASPSLVSALRELIQANDVTHYYIPRRWLYPDATRWIDEFPWSSDYQIRLVRNDPAFLWFEGVVHSGSRLNGPSRYLEWPIYHLDCAVSSEESRAAKVASYRADPIRPEGLGPEFFYLPERYVTKSPRPVPYADIDAITRVVRAQPVEQGSVPMYAALSVTRRAEINRHWDRRALPPEAYRGALAMLEPEIQIPAGWRRDVHLRVINLGSEMWPGGADRYPLIRIGYRW